MTLYEWLTNPKPNYAAGIELFKQFNPRDKQYLKYFNQVEDSQKGKPHFDMLHKQLARFARVHPDKAKSIIIEPKKIGVKKIIVGKKTRKPTANSQKPVEETEERKRIRISGEFELINPKDLPKELQLVFFDVKARFGQMKELHKKIKEAKPKDDIKSLTTELTGLEEINYKEWGKLDAFLKDGKPLKKKGDGTRSFIQEFQENERRIKTIGINTSRAKKELEQLELNKDSSKDAKELKSIRNRIKSRNINIPKWNEELKKLQARQKEIKNPE